MIIEVFGGAVRQNNVCLAGVNWSWYFLDTVQVTAFKSMHKNSFLWKFRRILIIWFEFLENFCLKIIFGKSKRCMSPFLPSFPDSNLSSVFLHCDFFVYHMSSFSSYVKCLLVAQQFLDETPGSELSPPCEGLSLAPQSLLMGTRNVSFWQYVS